MILGQPALKPERDEHFTRLAGEAAFGGEERDFGKLLRDRAAALRNAVAAYVAPERARKSAWIDAQVAVKPPIFNREKGFGHMGGQSFDFHRRANHCAIACDRLTVGCEQS